MASLERRGNRFRVIFRLGGRKHHVNVKATDEKDAEAYRVRLEENLRLVERGRLTKTRNSLPNAELVFVGRTRSPISKPSGPRTSGSLPDSVSFSSRRQKPVGWSGPNRGFSISRQRQCEQTACPETRCGCSWASCGRDSGTTFRQATRRGRERCSVGEMS